MRLRRARERDGQSRVDGVLDEVPSGQGLGTRPGPDRRVGDPGVGRQGRLRPRSEPGTPGWVSQTSCAQTLAMSGPPTLALARKTASALVLAVTAPALAVPVGAGCALNVRNDQLSAHVVLSQKKLKSPPQGSVPDAADRHLSAGARRRLRADARLLAADQAVRGLPHRRPVQRCTGVERHAQDHARVVARVVPRSPSSGNDRCARGGTRKFCRCVACTNELKP